MSKRFYCDSCDVLLSPDNMLPKRLEINHEFRDVRRDTPLALEIGITYGSNAAGGRVISSDGDFCLNCFRIVLLTYLRDTAGLADADVVEEEEEDDSLLVYDHDPEVEEETGEGDEPEYEEND